MASSSAGGDDGNDIIVVDYRVCHSRWLAGLQGTDIGYNVVRGKYLWLK